MMTAVKLVATQPLTIAPAGRMPEPHKYGPAWCRLHRGPLSAHQSRRSHSMRRCSPAQHNRGELLHHSTCLLIMMTVVSQDLLSSAAADVCQGADGQLSRGDGLLGVKAPSLHFVA